MKQLNMCGLNLFKLMFLVFSNIHVNRYNLKKLKYNLLLMAFVFYKSINITLINENTCVNIVKTIMHVSNQQQTFASNN